MCNKVLVLDRIKECLLTAEKHFNRSFNIPNVKFSKRGNVAGTANYGKYELNFNMVLLNENVKHFVQQTVAHEVAHLITEVVYEISNVRFGINGKRKKRQSHGKHWVSVMGILGVKPDRLHSYDVSNVSIRKTVKHDYQCSGCNKVLAMGAIRHKKMQLGMYVYYHNGCGKVKLVYVGKSN